MGADGRTLLLRRVVLQTVNRRPQQSGVDLDDVDRHSAQQISKAPLAQKACMNAPSVSCRAGRTTGQVVVGYPRSLR